MLTEAVARKSDSYNNVEAQSYLKYALGVRLTLIYRKIDGHDKPEQEELTKELSQFVDYIIEGSTKAGAFVTTLQKNMDYALKSLRSLSKPSPFFPLLGDCLGDYYRREQVSVGRCRARPYFLMPAPL